jgi:hypothetical protein
MSQGRRHKSPPCPASADTVCAAKKSPIFLLLFCYSKKYFQNETGEMPMAKKRSGHVVRKRVYRPDPPKLEGDSLRLMGGIWAAMTHELESEGFLKPNGTLDMQKVKRSKHSESSMAGAKIYRFVCDKLIFLQGDGKTLASFGNELNDVLHTKIPNTNSSVNPFFAALILLDKWIETYGAAVDRKLIGYTLQSLEDYFIEGMREVEGPALVRESYWHADNIFRVFTGKPVLDKELREKQFEYRYRRPIAAAS